MKTILTILLIWQFGFTSNKLEDSVVKFNETQEKEIIKCLLKTEPLNNYIRQDIMGSIRVFDLTKTITPDLYFGYETYIVKTYSNLLLDINVGLDKDFIIYKFDKITDNTFYVELFYSPHKRTKVMGKGKLLVDEKNIKFTEFKASQFQ